VLDFRCRYHTVVRRIWKGNTRCSAHVVSLRYGTTCTPHLSLQMFPIWPSCRKGPDEPIAYMYNDMSHRNEVRLCPMGEGGLELGSHFLAWLNKRKWQVTTGLTTTREIINLQIDRGYYSITKELISRLDNDLIDNAFPLANTQTLTRPPSPERGRPWLTEPACGALTPSGRCLFGIIFVFPDPIEAGRVSTCSH
jgi:hypothetical protein